MKTWIRRSLLGLFGASIALGGLTACGYGRHHHAGWHASPEEQARMRDRMVERVADRLELSADQKARLATLATTLQQQRAAVAGQPDPRAQMQALVAGDKFDRARAQALVEEKTAAVRTRSPEVIAALGEFYDSLDARQQGKVREFLQHRHGRWWWRRG
ncbi:MAG TPA: Spy/CpxP family protein refolding chaperone [Ramlibacter sp.]|nr:Spy/CpxP family protein refolding chaperone [Ramlibacter sp.]